MIEGLQLSIPQRLGFIRTTLLLSLIVSVLLSFRLWAGDRDFPYVAVIEGLYVPYAVHFILTMLLLLFWLAALFLKHHRLFIVLSCLLSLLLICIDLNRLQPWFYVYLVMLMIFVFYTGRVDDSNKFTSYLIILQLMLASVYFFNGLNALNPFYTQSSYLETLAPLRNWMSERQFAFFVKSGTFMPYVMMFIGVGLIISSIRYLAITTAFIFHLILLVLLFPSAHNSNYALWMTNLTFLILMLLLFSGRTKQKYFSPTVLFQRFVFYPILVFFLILPFFNAFGLWPDFLSANYRTGNNFKMKLSMSESVYLRLPGELKSYCTRESYMYSIDPQKWCLKELNADYFPDELEFEYMRAYILQTTGADPEEVSLVQLSRYNLWLRR